MHSYPRTFAARVSAFDTRLRVVCVGAGGGGGGRTAQSCEALETRHFRCSGQPELSYVKLHRPDAVDVALPCSSERNFYRPKRIASRVH